MALDEPIGSAALFRPPTIKPPEHPLNTLQLIRRGTRNPIEMWPAAIFEKPVISRKFLGATVHFIAGPEYLKAVMLDHVDNFPRGVMQERVLKPAMGEGLLTSSGETWKRQRRAASPAFRIDNLRAMIPAMVRAGDLAANELVSHAASAPVDVLPIMTMATLEVIMDLLLSSDDTSIDRNQVADMVATYRNTLGSVDVLDMFGAPKWIPRPWTKKGRIAIEQMRAACDAQIESRRQNPKQDGEPLDLLDLMIRAEDPQTGVKFSDIELRDNIMTFISAGHETTSLALTWTLYLIANAPDVQERLFQEGQARQASGNLDADGVQDLTYHLQVVREAMRLFPPAPVRSNITREDITIDGVHFRKGDHVVCLMYAAHRHKTLWDRPEAFDPENFSPEAIKKHHRFQYLPFGGGPRICIAMKMAEMEAVAILARLVQRVKFHSNPGHIPLPVVKITASPSGGMPLGLEVR